MIDRIKNFVENLELKAKRHELAEKHFKDCNELELMNLHKGHAQALRNTIEWIEVDFLKAEQSDPQG